MKTKELLKEFPVALPQFAQDQIRKMFRDIEIERERKKGDPKSISPELLQLQRDDFGILETRFSPEIQELTQKVIDAANGKPLKTSITAEREKEEIAGSFIKQFILRMMNGDDMGIKENPEPKKEETT